MYQRLFILIILLIPLSFCKASVEKLLTIAFLDVGQGDAVYVEAPNGNQMIIDGGPGKALSARLHEVMPFGDRSIDVLMVTNPDADHYAGFIDALRDYDVGAVIEPGTRSTTKTYEEFQVAVEAEKAPHLYARKGMKVTLDGEAGVYFSVLFPDQDVSAWNRNDGSIVGQLVYGKTKIMLTGDSTKKTENVIVQGNTREVLDSDILKVGHHGSRTSSGDEFLWAVSPLYAVISLGKDNTYGHPHEEVVQNLSRQAGTVLLTSQDGTVVFVSDGQTLIRR